MTESKPQIKIVNCETGEEFFRDATEAEIKQMALDKIENEKIRAKAMARIEARQAILDRLGLTEDEARLLLG